MQIEAKIDELGLVLPAPMWLPEGFQAKWRQVRVVGTRAVIAGHGPRADDGSPGRASGKVGDGLTLDDGYLAARSAGLAILADLKRELRDLDRITTWVRVFGLVNSPSGFQMQPLVIDGFTALMIELFGEDSALCPRAVAGAVELPFGSPVIIEGEVEVTDG